MKDNLKTRWITLPKFLGSHRFAIMVMKAVPIPNPLTMGFVLWTLIKKIPRKFQLSSDIEKDSCENVLYEIFNFINQEFYSHSLELNKIILIDSVPKCLFGKYNERSKKITIYFKKQSPEDVLFTFSHELAHLIHHQYFKDKFMRDHLKMLKRDYGYKDEEEINFRLGHNLDFESIKKQNNEIILCLIEQRGIK